MRMHLTMMKNNLLCDHEAALYACSIVVLGCVSVQLWKQDEVFIEEITSRFLQRHDDTIEQ